MAALRYRDEHNKVGYLLKPTRSDDYHQIIDFLRASHIRSPELGPLAIQATIDETPYTITKDLVRSQLQLADDGGIDDLPITEIYSRMDNLSPLVVALICLSDGRQFNWSSYIFKGMVSNIGNAKKFLMYPRFLQTILGKETIIKRQYQVLKFSSKLFANMRLNFKGNPMPLLAAMLSQDQEGEGAGVAAQAVQQHMPTPDQPQDYLSTPSRQQTSDPNALVFKHDEPLGGSFHMSLPMSTQALPAGQTSGGLEDLSTLTALSYVVSTLVQKVNSLETELKDHKKLFKDVVGKLVKKVKAMEVKLKTTKKKLVVSDSDQEEGRKQDVDLDALLTLANTAVTVDSNIPSGGASNNPAASTSVHADVPTSANVPTGSTSVPADVPTSVAPGGVSNKGKTLMTAKRLHDEEQAQVDRQRAELQRKRQQEVLASAMYYIEADWINIMAQVEANASLSKTLMGDDVSEDNFPAIMAALIKKQKQALVEKLAKERKDRPMTQGQQRTYIRHFSLKRFKRFYQPFRFKPLADANDQTFIKVVFNEDSKDEAPCLWSALVGWEVIPTPLGDINSLYRIDRSTAHFTTLRQILHMVDRQDLVTLHGLVVKYYENHPVAGAGLILWGDLQVLFDSHKGDVPYPLSVKLMERMLKHKLEIDKDVVSNDMTTAEQLIQFIKNQLADAQHADVAFSKDIPLVCVDFSSILVKTQSSRFKTADLS
uniref:JmjC domain-containing protein n=1 Tax=Tanacetum cinerariifolium TaxID=118510 RepID=A0A6L2KR36_TANCI|nr:JmjC domain-containing protein [Tanacetum cinerariifolium]